MNAPLVILLGWIALSLATLVGYVLNILAIISMIGEELGAELVVRCVGLLVFPVGALLGYFA